MWPWKKKKTEINEDTEIVSDLEKTDPSLRSAVRYYLENEDDEDIWKKFAGIAEAGSLEAYCIAKALQEKNFRFCRPEEGLPEAIEDTVERFKAEALNNNLEAAYRLARFYYWAYTDKEHGQEALVLLNKVYDGGLKDAAIYLGLYMTYLDYNSACYDPDRGEKFLREAVDIPKSFAGTLPWDRYIAPQRIAEICDFYDLFDMDKKCTEVQLRIAADHGSTGAAERLEEIRHRRKKGETFL